MESLETRTLLSADGLVPDAWVADTSDAFGMAAAAEGEDPAMLASLTARVVENIDASSSGPVIRPDVETAAPGDTIRVAIWLKDDRLDDGDGNGEPDNFGVFASYTDLEFNSAAFFLPVEDANNAPGKPPLVGVPVSFQNPNFCGTNPIAGCEPAEYRYPNAPKADLSLPGVVDNLGSFMQGTSPIGNVEEFFQVDIKFTVEALSAQDDTFSVYAGVGNQRLDVQANDILIEGRQWFVPQPASTHGTDNTGNETLAFGYTGYGSDDLLDLDPKGVVVPESLVNRVPDYVDVVNNGTLQILANFTQPQNGAVVLNADGSFTYTPGVGATPGSTDSFQYTLSDGNGNEKTATVSLAVAAANVFVVNSTGDAVDNNLADDVCDTGGTVGADPECTLRAAIQQANATPNLNGTPDLIAFDIPGAGPHTIQPGSVLPTITGAVFIDGMTEPDFAGSPVIELDGTNAGAGSSGLNVFSGGSTVQGLAINRFGANGIQMAVAGGNTIQGNFIGTDITGAADRGNGQWGVKIVGIDNNTIGGAGAAGRNLISGNEQSGILISGGNSNIVQGNYIGTEVTGTIGRGNTRFGIVIGGASANNVIGGSTAGTVGVSAPGEGNTISGNRASGIALDGAGVTGTKIYGNWIGTDSSGEVLVSNVFHGVQITGGSAANTIGGTPTDGKGNLISGNLTGIFVQGGGSNVIQENFVGTDVTGTVDLGNRLNGIQISNSSTLNTVGSSLRGTGNLVSGNNGVGVALSGAGTLANTVQGNRIGTDASGVADLGNGRFGFLIEEGSSNIIGGVVDGAGNVISGNDNIAVVITGANAAGNMLSGNRIGTNATGTGSVANTLHGVQIGGGADGNVLGGTEAGAGNVISGNGRLGVLVTGPGTTGNLIQGNRIGTSADGDTAVGNGLHGIQISTLATGNTVGGAVAGAGNQISGNVQSGVFISGAGGNFVYGNLIGTDAAGATALGNGLNGLQISNSLATGNIVGGVGSGNVISGNAKLGVAISESASANVVSGNLIGTDVAGAAAVPNGTFGMFLSNAIGNTIGGTTEGAGNVISGNTLSGMLIQGGNGNDVYGNVIGADIEGATALANAHYGIMMLTDTTGNTIGGTTAGEGNTLAFNGAGGLRVQNLSINNALRGNAIFDNAGLGIDLVGTANDPGDADTGPNQLQNSPVIAAATLSGGNLEITYLVDSATVNSAYDLAIDVYVADAAGQEGATYLGTDTYPAASAQSSRTAAIAVTGASVGDRIVATATDANGNTSEFSTNIIIAAPLSAASESTGTSAAMLTSAELQPIVDAAIGRWNEAGITDGQLATLVSTQFVIGDLAGAFLGQAAGDIVTIDVNAAGYGWFVDPTPDADEEFGFLSSTQGTAYEADAAERMDLLTAVLHEMGHLLGLDHADGGSADDLMDAILGVGQRKLPS